MLTEVMEHFRLERDLLMAGYYETDHHRQLIKDVKASILAGRLVAVAGVVGSGKTVLLRRIQDELTRDGRVTVSKSLSVDKERTTIPTLITALFYDLSPDKDPKIPTLGEKRGKHPLSAAVRPLSSARGLPSIPMAGVRAGGFGAYR